ncbi:MAG: tetratricopeptide repeat protein [Candidatus Riflebacteria bacterium]|nr:tetratricopeptide repeat protein [Candidatus Riflebacteria bacterium]
MSRFKWLEFDSPENRKTDGFDKLPGNSETAGVDLTNPGHVLRLADENYRKLEYERALKYYSKVLGIDPNIEEAWFGQLLCLLDLEEIPEALTWSIKANKLFPKSANIISARALASARDANLKDAMAFSDGAMKNDNVSWFSWIARGEIIALTKGNNAEFCMMKAIELLPNDWLVFFKIAQSYSNTPLFEKAIPVLQKALSKKSDLPEIYYLLGVIQNRLNLHSAAEESFSRANKLAPVNKKYNDAYCRAINKSLFSKVFSWVKGLFVK